MSIPNTRCPLDNRGLIIHRCANSFVLFLSCSGVILGTSKILNRQSSIVNCQSSIVNFKGTLEGSDEGMVIKRLIKVGDETKFRGFFTEFV